jgi:hypothetical protein
MSYIIARITEKAIDIIDDENGLNFETGTLADIIKSGKKDFYYKFIVDECIEDDDDCFQLPNSNRYKINFDSKDFKQKVNDDFLGVNASAKVAAGPDKVAAGPDNLPPPTADATATATATGLGPAGPDKVATGTATGLGPPGPDNVSVSDNVSESTQNDANGPDAKGPDAKGPDIKTTESKLLNFNQRVLEELKNKSLVYIKCGNHVTIDGYSNVNGTVVNKDIHAIVKNIAIEYSYDKLQSESINEDFFLKRKVKLFLCNNTDVTFIVEKATITDKNATIDKKKMLSLSPLSSFDKDYKIYSLKKCSDNKIVNDQALYFERLEFVYEEIHISTNKDFSVTLEYKENTIQNKISQTFPIKELKQMYDNNKFKILNKITVPVLPVAAKVDAAKVDNNGIAAKVDNNGIAAKVDNNGIAAAAAKLKEEDAKYEKITETTNYYDGINYYIKEENGTYKLQNGKILSVTKSMFGNLTAKLNLNKNLSIACNNCYIKKTDKTQQMQKKQKKNKNDSDDSGNEYIEFLSKNMGNMEKYK